MEIREVRGFDELRAVEELQKTVWGIEEREIVSGIHMTAAREVGAILLGAFDEARMIGFVYGFPGFEEAERVIHSDMLAVLPQYRDRGVGRDLKMAQRKAALARGVCRITWTFDPLQARNAFLNFSKLGVISKRYKRDFYGQTSSPLHALGTDRLWVTWMLDQPRPRVDGAPRLIEIPRDVNSLSRDEALRWRQRVRDEFEEAFAAGYVALDFDRERSVYVLVSTSS